jgi:hypothetical protein
MANLVTQNGLVRNALNASQATGYSSSRYNRTLATDDSSVAFTATDTACNSGGTVTTFFDVALSSAVQATTTFTNDTIRHTATIPSGSGQMTIRRISLHDDTTANVTSSSTTLVAGIDAQSLSKNTTFALTLVVDLIYSV